jgi:hypothetical protein
MKKTICLITLAALFFSVAPLYAQVVVEPADGNIAAPAAPTPGGERRAIRREDRRIDRNDPTGTLAPTVNPNGTVTATPNAAALVPGPAVGVNANARVAPETWRYRYQGGQWLYYTPQNNWMVYSGNGWNAYTANANMVPPVAPQTVVTPAPAVRSYSYPTYSNGYYSNGYYNDGYNNGYYRRGLFGRRRY